MTRHEDPTHAVQSVHSVHSGEWADWRTDTAERRVGALDDRTRAIAPVVPDLAPRTDAESPTDLPRPPRWPLYADQATAPAPLGVLRRGRLSSAVPWVTAALAVAVLGAGMAAVLGEQERVLVVAVDGDPGLGVRPDTTSADPDASDRDAGSSRGASRTGATADGRAEASRERAPRRDLRSRATSVVGLATASAPTTAAPNQDLAGASVSYDAANLLDSRPETAWRMPGDGSATVLTLRLDRPTDVTSVGVVNGYAKTATSGDRDVDWYASNRRVREVEWFFDDGSRVVQALRETRELQTTDVPVTRTSTVRMRISEVTRPGDGPDGRDFTAVSEIALTGVTAGD